LTVSTTGSDLDSDGYTVGFDGAAGTTVGNNQTSIFRLGIGEHTLTIGGVAQNCHLAEQNPQGFTIAADSTTSITASVSCDPTTTGVWTVAIGPATVNCTITNLTLNITEKHNPTQPVDSILGRYAGGQGTCPFDEGTGFQDYPVSFPLDSILYGLVDRRGTDTTVSIQFGDPSRGSMIGAFRGDSIVGSLFIFVQDPRGNVVRANAVARR
jgi:hypothetical protein